MGVAGAPSSFNVVYSSTDRIIDKGRLAFGGARRTEEDHEHYDVTAEVVDNDDHAHDEHHHKEENELNIFESEM